MVGIWAISRDGTYRRRVARHEIKRVTRLEPADDGINNQSNMLPRDMSLEDGIYTANGHSPKTSSTA